MATLAIAPGTTIRRRLPLVNRTVLGWLLMLPFVFLAVHGNFSYQDTSNNQEVGSSLSLLASPDKDNGFVGYVVIPGIAYSIVVWLIVVNASRIWPLALRMKALTLLAVLTVVSAIWSQAPFRSAYNGIFYLVGTLFAYYLSVRFDPERLMSVVKLAGVVLLAMSVAMVVLYPSIALTHFQRDLGAWQGVFGDRTSAAKCMVFLLSPAILFHRQSLSLKNLLYLAVVGLFVFMTKSATARALTLVYVLLMALVRTTNRFGKRSTVLVATLFAGCALVLAYFGLAAFGDIVQHMGRDVTLSGRTIIWDLVMRSIEKRPVLGYGYYAFWQGMSGESANAIVATHWIFGYAHNGYLEICLQLGVVGLATFLYTLAQAVRNSWICIRNGCPPAVEWYIGVIALTVMYNFDEATVVWPNDLLSILYIVACVGLARSARIYKRKTLWQLT